MKFRSSVLRLIILAGLMVSVCGIVVAQKVIQKQKVTIPMRNLPVREMLTPLPTAPAITFRPFTLQELQSKIPGLKATDMLTLKNPKTSQSRGQIRASTLVDSLNKYEQSFNKLGYSLRNPAAVKNISRKLAMNDQLVQSRKSAFQAKLKTNVAPPAFLSMPESQRVSFLKRSRAMHAQEWKSLKSTLKQTSKTTLPAQSIAGSNSATCALGDPEKFAVELIGTSNQNATYQEVSVENSTKLRISILGQSVDLVGVGAKLSAGPASNSYTPNGEILGLSFSGSAEQLSDLKYDKTVVPFDPPEYSWTIPIIDGVVAILKVKVHADVGVLLIADAREMFVNLQVDPLASTDVTVGAGVAVGGVVGIELAGRLQFFSGGINVDAVACEETQSPGGALKRRLSVSDYCNTWGSALGGDLSLYWWMGLCPFCVDGSIPLFVWPGIDLYGELFSDRPKSTEWQAYPSSSSNMSSLGRGIAIRSDTLWARQGNWQRIVKPVF